jgi:hypothetical protein
VDFVVLLAIGWMRIATTSIMSRAIPRKIDEALGNKEWQERWAPQVRRRGFRPFLADEFSKSMVSLGYLKKPLHRMKDVRYVEKNLPLY